MTSWWISHRWWRNFTKRSRTRSNCIWISSSWWKSSPRFFCTREIPSQTWSTWLFYWQGFWRSLLVLTIKELCPELWATCITWLKMYCVHYFADAENQPRSWLPVQSPWLWWEFCSLKSGHTTYSNFYQTFANCCWIQTRQHCLNGKKIFCCAWISCFSSVRDCSSKASELLSVLTGFNNSSLEERVDFLETQVNFFNPLPHFASIEKKWLQIVIKDRKQHQPVSDGRLGEWCFHPGWWTIAAEPASWEPGPEGWRHHQWPWEWGFNVAIFAQNCQ